MTAWQGGWWDFYMEWLRRHPHLHDKVEFDVVPTCYALDFERWRERLIHEGGFNADEADRLGVGLKTITACAIARTDADLQVVDRFEERLACFRNTDASSLDDALSLLEECRRYGTLAFAHLARSAFVAITLLRSAVEKGVLSQGAMDAFLNSIRTVFPPVYRRCCEGGSSRIVHGRLHPTIWALAARYLRHNLALLWR